MKVCVCGSEELKDDLDHYVRDQLQGKVKLVRNQRREGLIRGRMIGASHATGTYYIIPAFLGLHLLVSYSLNPCILIAYMFPVSCDSSHSLVQTLFHVYLQLPRNITQLTAQMQ